MNLGRWYRTLSQIPPRQLAARLVFEGGDPYKREKIERLLYEGENIPLICDRSK